MPSIKICGYADDKAALLRERINEIMSSLGLARDSVTSIARMEVRSCCSAVTEPQPYLEIHTTDPEEALAIIAAMSKVGIQEDTEILKLNCFVPAMR